MNGFWRVNLSLIWVMLELITGFLQLNFICCWTLNDEGIALLKFRERVVNDPFGALSSWTDDAGENKPCSWFGIECVDGHVISLDLRNLGLEGTLAPELHLLSHIKSIILRNNSFSGLISEEIGQLKQLELLDLGCNNFSGALPPELGLNIAILLLDNNGPSLQISPEIRELVLLSEAQVDENHLRGAEKSSPHNRHGGWTKDGLHPRMLLRNSSTGNNQSGTPTASSSRSPDTHNKDPKNDITSGEPFSSRSPPSPEPNTQRPSQPPLPPNPPASSSSTPPPPFSPPLSSTARSPHSSGRNLVPMVVGPVAGVLGVVLIAGIYLWKSHKISNVTGLSGQLQKAFVAGVSNLKRSELETACEDFSNVIGFCSIGTIYKGTLSSGIEIAVISLAVTSAKDWSRNLENQFRRKIEILSKVNHKNFVNLIGYCEEENPFSRMMVFEYAPNGSLFEHLHIKESEHLDWDMRLRVVMGMTGCLEYMHQLVPPITHPNLNSSAVHLSEDYAAKISDFCIWNEVSAPQAKPMGISSLIPSSTTPESNVYSFGLVLLEVMTGRIAGALGRDSLEDWVSEYLEGETRLEELVDPMLRHFNSDQLEKIGEVIRKCLNPDPKLRLTMKDVNARLREITGIERERAGPRLSPLWWAELEAARPVNGG